MSEIRITTYTSTFIFPNSRLMLTNIRETFLGLWMFFFFKEYFIVLDVEPGCFNMPPPPQRKKHLITLKNVGNISVGMRIRVTHFILQISGYQIFWGVNLLFEAIFCNKSIDCKVILRFMLNITDEPLAACSTVNIGYLVNICWYKDTSQLNRDISCIYWLLNKVSRLYMYMFLQQLSIS